MLTADVTVFDPDRIQDRATFDNGRAPAEGVSHVFVNGEAAIESGRLSHTSAGRVLRVYDGNTSLSPTAET